MNCALRFNLSQWAQPAELDLGHYEGCTPIEMMGAARFPSIGASRINLP